MKTAKFKLSDLHKPASVKRVAPKKGAWIDEFLRQRDKLIKALQADGVTKLA